VITPTAEPATTGRHALDGLRRAIAAGELRPGERIRQEEVANALGVSVAPVREALATLEQEGQVAYRPRRGYFVAELDMAELEEIYGLRRLLEERAARAALPELDDAAIERIAASANECADAAESGDVAAELAANRRFHFGILEAAGQAQALRLIRLLWDSTEAYRAIYYNSPESRRSSLDAHERILGAIRDRDADRLVAELDAHRAHALEALGALLTP
jgi:DNA-binding GntR family transcriptional regulator